MDAQAVSPDDAARAVGGASQVADVAVAVDVGPARIATGLVDTDGVVWNRAQRRTVAADGDATWAAVCSALTETLDVAAGRQPAGVGISCTGPVDPPSGTVSPINLPGWRGFPITTRVREVIADVTGAPVAGLTAELATDGVCMALGEAWTGAAESTSTLLSVLVSSTVGGGLILDGSAHHGRTGNAGNVGHIVVEPDGAPCPCGGRGCLETVAGGPGLVRWARVKGWQAPSHARPEHLAAAAMNGDELAKTAFERAGYGIGLAAVAVATVCDLDVVVVGGSVARVGSLLFDPIRRAVNTHAGLPHLDTLRIVPSTLDHDATLVGAAALVLRSA
jgi:glucokinase